ncbi:MAG: hypothetical protein Q9160_000097 [Pyrenula sp. 1 TL-2023]
MSLKQEIETWVQALGSYDNNEFEEALRVFENISDTSKILFNCGVIHATLGEHEKAVECYQRAIKCDQYLAVAYFQEGVSNFLVGDFEEALANFNDTLLYLRGNTYIDYEQLGLKFRLYSCEVLFNRGLCYIYLQQEGPGMQDFNFAIKEKVTPDHDVIDEAIREKAEGYTVFSIPVGVVYRPNDAKVKNLKTKDYLGKARLVAASDRTNAFTGFAGSENKRMLEAPKGEDDRLPESISYAASNLVQRNLTSKRQQSEPPINRNMFPPTPPPENDKPSNPPGMTGRAASVRNPPPRPLQRTATEPVEPFRNQSPANMMQPPSRNMMYSPPQMDRPQMDRPRAGTIRTASEPRGPPQRQYSRAPNNRPQLYRETTQDDGIYDDVYDLYNTPRSSQGGMAGGRQRPRTGRNQAQQRYFNEEEEYGSDGMYEDDSVDEGDFEMMGGNAPPPLRAGGRRPSMSTGGRAGSRRPDVSKIRVKVHAESDTRYIIVGPAVEYGDFEGRIREKFGIKTRLKIKMKDDGDMITMGDQDDLDMLVSIAKQMARKERSDMGKMEVWVMSS